MTADTRNLLTLITNTMLPFAAGGGALWLSGVHLTQRRWCIIGIFTAVFFLRLGWHVFRIWRGQRALSEIRDLFRTSGHDLPPESPRPYASFFSTESVVFAILILGCGVFHRFMR